MIQRQCKDLQLVVKISIFFFNVNITKKDQCFGTIMKEIRAKTVKRVYLNFGINDRPKRFSRKNGRVRFRIFHIFNGIKFN